MRNETAYPSQHRPPRDTHISRKRPKHPGNRRLDRDGCAELPDEDERRHDRCPGNRMGGLVIYLDERIATGGFFKRGEITACEKHCKDHSETQEPVIEFESTMDFGTILAAF